jgi:glycosyltransferase involved in cell wall biosynthesis
MKIARVGRICTRVFPDRGGPANHVFNMVINQNALGIQNIVVSTTPLGIHQEIQKSLKRLPFSAPKSDSGILSNFLFAIAYLTYSSLFCVITFLRRRVDIIHAHSPGISGLVGLLVSRIIRKPLVYTVHGLAGPKHPWTGFQGNLLDLVLEKLVLRNAEGIILISDDYRRMITQFKPKGLIAEIGNGVDLIKYHPVNDIKSRESLRRKYALPIDEILMIWVGNFDLNEKVDGVIDTLHSLKELSGMVSNSWKYLLVGDGQEKSRIHEIIQSLNLEKNVILMGEQKQIPSLLQSADVFILVSHHEGSPNSLLEAMASGLACIGSDTGGIPQIVGDSGIIIPIGDMKALKDSIERILTDSDLRVELSHKARLNAEMNHSWSSIARRTLELYQGLVTNRI